MENALQTTTPGGIGAIPGPPPVLRDAKPARRGGRPAAGQPLSTNPEAVRSRNRKRAAAAAKRAAAEAAGGAKVSGSPAAKSQAPKAGAGTQTGAGGEAGRSEAQGETNPPSLVVNQPEPVSMFLQAEKQAQGVLEPVLTQLTLAISHIIASSQRIIPAEIVQAFPELNEMCGPEAMKRDPLCGRYALQYNWMFSETDANAIAAPAAALFPNLPDKAKKQLEKYMPYVALAGALYSTIVPRLNNQREIVNAIRAYNAGTVQPTPQPGAGQPRSQNQGSSNGNNSGAGSNPNANVDISLPGPFRGTVP